MGFPILVKYHLYVELGPWGRTCVTWRPSSLIHVHISRPHWVKSSWPSSLTKPCIYQALGTWLVHRCVLFWFHANRFYRYTSGLHHSRTIIPVPVKQRWIEVSYSNNAYQNWTHKSCIFIWMCILCGRRGVNFWKTCCVSNFKTIGSCEIGFGPMRWRLFSGVGGGGCVATA